MIYLKTGNKEMRRAALRNLPSRSEEALKQPAAFFCFLLDCGRACEAVPRKERSISWECGPRLYPLPQTKKYFSRKVAPGVCCPQKGVRNILNENRLFFPQFLPLPDWGKTFRKSFVFFYTRDILNQVPRLTVQESANCVYGLPRHQFPVSYLLEV